MIAHDAIKAMINLSADANVVKVLDDEDFISKIVLTIMVIQTI